MPSASEGAPPVRPKSVCLADAVGQLSHVAGGDRKSPARMVATAACGVAPTTPAGEFTAK